MYVLSDVSHVVYVNIVYAFINYCLHNVWVYWVQLYKCSIWMILYYWVRVFVCLKYSMTFCKPQRNCSRYRNQNGLTLIVSMLQTTFWNSFFCMKMYVFWVKFKGHLFLVVKSTISPHDSYIGTYGCVARPWWLKAMVYIDGLVHERCNSSALAK